MLCVCERERVCVFEKDTEMCERVRECKSGRV